MSQIISIHSYRGGTGKSNTTANIATLLAMGGARVGVVDTDIASPGIHILFGLDLEEDKNSHSLNDYLWGKCSIDEAAHDVTANVDPGIKGKIFLIPSSIKAGEIARILREGYDVGLLNDGFRDVVDKLNLDYLLIDTHPGLNEETLLSIAISNALVIILRPDQQDFQGTSVTVDVAKKLEVPKLIMLVNKTPPSLKEADLISQVTSTYEAEVGAVLYHSDEMMELGSNGIFSVKFPNHAMTKSLKKLVARLTE